MDDTHPRPILGFFVGLPLAVLPPVAGAIGYYAVACPNSNPVGWALIWLILMPIAFPPALLIWLIAAFMGSFYLEPARSIQRLGSVSLGVLAASAVTCGISWLIATVTGASARCSFGF